MKSQSFSEKIKSELMEYEALEEEWLPEIAGIFKGHLRENHLKFQDDKVMILSDNIFVIYRLNYLLSRYLNRSLTIYKETKLVSYLQVSQAEIDPIFEKINDYGEEDLFANCMLKEQTKAFLRGIFIGGGYVSNPEKNYHLELSCYTRNGALTICEMMSTISIKAKFLERKNSFIIYIKEAEQIGNLLVAIGAHQGLLMLENIRIVKEISNSVNRRVNCDAANIKKTVDASIKQVREIEYVISKIGLEGLPNKLREIASVRLEYPDDTLGELGERLEPKVSKSGVYHRLKKIEEMAANL